MHIKPTPANIVQCFQSFNQLYIYIFFFNLGTLHHIITRFQISDFYGEI